MGLKTLKQEKLLHFLKILDFNLLLVCGGSGSGKTSMVFEPFIARDLERKFFYSEVSKEMGFTALKTKIAVLNKPYSNDFFK